jgi:eukaryotic-like serine/threonine-protein kinase
MRLEAGQMVADRYRLIRRLGSGGMADVWLAEDQELGRQVALKFLLERFAQDRPFVERFRREATAAAGLQHPNVVGIYDRGEWEGVHYIAMEYVDGASLRDLIARGLSVPEAVEIVRQILAGVGFAHERGIVHRDLKPLNVLVDRDGRARVADFGIARAGASEITQAGSVLGTAQYLSPEQAQGREVTPASDLYSVGVLLYEALTGRLPFEAETPVAVALKQISERPRPPRELNPEVSPALEAVVLRALAKDPANRFSSASEFRRALDAAEANPQATEATALIPAAAPPAAAEAAAAPEAPAPEGTPEEEERGWRRWLHGWRLAALVAALLLLAFAVVAVFALTRSEQVNVPTVIGQDRDSAVALLQGRGFQVNVLPRPACAEADQVIEQDPAAGEQADEGSTVTLTVSIEQQVTVPPVQNLSAARARERLRDADLLIVQRPRFSDTVRAGRAIATDPAAGSEVPCESSVTLLVSRGADLALVPSVVGLQQSTAQSRLEARGFVVDVDTRNADEPEGEVIDQSPGEGSRIEEGSRVTIVVSTGAGSVVVPDVVGQPETTARSTLLSRGVTNLRIVERPTEEESEDGIVIDQAPGPGTRILSTDQVTIFVGEFVPPPEPPPQEEELGTPPADGETPPADGATPPGGEKGGLGR